MYCWWIYWPNFPCCRPRKSLRSPRNLETCPPVKNHCFRRGQWGSTCFVRYC